MTVSRTAFARLLTVVVMFAGLIISRPAPAQWPRAYDPACGPADEGCHAWADLRRMRPYPYQDIAIRTTETGNQIVIVTEPPPRLAAIDIEGFVADLFGDRFRAVERRRWQIGLDGWLEDLIVTLTPAPDDDRFEDQLAFLYSTVFDTTFGGDFLVLDERTAAPLPIAQGNLAVSAADLNRWVSEPALRMHPLTMPAARPLTWRAVMSSAEPQAYVSHDGTLVALVLPRQLLRGERGNGEDSHPLQASRALLRRFFVASDLLLGGLWNDTSVTILGRRRQASLTDLPPLRSETAILLADQRADELAQSYERNAVFAGKLYSGEYAFMDWAPTYLSEALVDSELGALLNITDQMLKSWSQAGTIEYLYFDYPRKPDQFAFGPESLSDILLEQYDSTETLFNWNTSGAAAVVEFPAHTILAVGRTGALPVTYGSQATGDSELATGHLYDYEDTAYAYFANRGDPNLIRVRQYTTLYQIFRALGGDEEGPVITQSPRGPAPSAATAFMETRILELLQQEAATEPLATELRRFRALNPAIADAMLARVLANPRRELPRIVRMEVDVLERRRVGIERRQRQFAVEAAAWMRRVEGGAFTPRRQREGLALGERRRALTQDVAEFRDEEAAATARLRSFGTIRRAAGEVEASVVQRESVRAGYVSADDRDPRGSIRTPTIVLSWSTASFGAEGGHSLDSTALRFEPSASVANIAIVETDRGRVLRYNPSLLGSIAAYANDIARSVEHRHLREVGLSLSEAPPPRARTDVLRIEGPRGPDVAAGARLGRRQYTNVSGLVRDLQNVARANDCCLFVAKGSNGDFLLVRPDPSLPGGSFVVAAADAPSFRVALAAEAAEDGRDIVFLEHVESEVEFLTAGLSGPTPSPSRLAGLLGRTASPREPGAVIRYADGRQTRFRDLGTAAGSRGGILNWVAEFMRRRIRPEEALTTGRLLEAAETARLLEGSGWDVAADGVPVAYVVSFDRGPSRLGVSALVGLAEQHVESGSSILRTAVEGVVRSLGRETELTALLDALREELEELPADVMDDFRLVVEHGEWKVEFSRRHDWMLMYETALTRRS